MTEENQKSTTKYNKFFNKLKPYIIPVSIVISIYFIVSFISFSINNQSVNKNNTTSSKIVPNNNVVVENNTTKEKSIKTKQKAPAEILDEIDKYQAKYFEIIKRNDMFLQIFEYDDNIKDQNDLLDLYNKVKSHINKNNIYFKKYEELEEKYLDNPRETTYELNQFAEEYYNESVKLINEVYQQIKTKITQEDFNELKTSELKWIKDTKNYEKVFKEQNYGTIGTSIYYSYNIDMQKFRTLLLMLYL